MTEKRLCCNDLVCRSHRGPRRCAVAVIANSTAMLHPSSQGTAQLPLLLVPDRVPSEGCVLENFTSLISLTILIWDYADVSLSPNQNPRGLTPIREKDSE